MYPAAFSAICVPVLPPWAGGAFSSVETRGAWARNLHWKRPLLIVPRPRKTGFFPLQSGAFRGVPPRLAAGLAVCLQRRRPGAVQHEKEPLLGSVNTRRAVPEGIDGLVATVAVVRVSQPPLQACRAP